MEASHASASSGDPLIGVTLDGRYTVRRRIGEGGMGIVYEAEHAIIGKRVALKVLRRDYSSRPDVVERFKQEAQSASRVDSPHIIDISDFGETPEGDSYFVMEFLDGEDLSNRIREGQSLNADLAIDIALQCCDALGAAHAAYIVHRDMKPENIFLTTRRGNPAFVKIVDFGIAKMNDVSADAPTMKKLTKTGMIFGTPEYMSPEQAAGKPMDHRVDIYAMGIILYEMFAGTVPFLGDTFMGVLTKHLFDSPPTMKEVNPNAEYPAAVESIILRCMQKDPDDRYQTMEELAEALRSCQKTGTVAVVSGNTQMGWAGTDSTAPPRVPRMIDPEDARASEFPIVGKGNKTPMLVALGLGMLVLAAGLWAFMGRSGQEPIETAEVAQQSTAGAEKGAAEANEKQEPEKQVVESGPEVVQGVSASTVETTYPLTIEYADFPGAKLYINTKPRPECTSSPCVVDLKNGLHSIRLKVGRKIESQDVVIDGKGEIMSFTKRQRAVSQPRAGGTTTAKQGEAAGSTVTGITEEQVERISERKAEEVLRKNEDRATSFRVNCVPGVDEDCPAK